MPTEGTTDAEQPFFSPDGVWIGFWARDQIRKVPSQGGPATPICESAGRAPFGASWGDDGTVVFAPATNAEIWRVRKAGGTAEPATVVAPGEQGHRLPQLLPNGALLVTVKRSASALGTDVHVQPAGGTTHWPVLGAAADARYVASWPTREASVVSGRSGELPRTGPVSQRGWCHPVHEPDWCLPGRPTGRPSPMLSRPRAGTAPMTTTLVRWR